MSGSGSSGGFGSGGTGGQGVDCSNFSYETHIHSPVQSELIKLNIGDVLQLTLATHGTVEVIQVMNGTTAVGGIVDRGPTLRQCLAKGFEYEADVRSISGAEVKIYIRPR